jgi:hypothetical protein
VFEYTETVHAVDRTATVIDNFVSGNLNAGAIVTTFFFYVRTQTDRKDVTMARTAQVL